VLDPQVRSAWADHLRTLGTTYLILDCLRPLLDALSLDEQHDAGRLLVAFDQLLAEPGIREAAVVHHMGHGGERARGDSRVRDWPDVEWQLFRRSDDPASGRYIRAFGRDVNVLESTLAFNLVFRHLSLTGGGSRRDAEVEQALAAILAVLGVAAKPMSGREVEATLEADGHPRNAIRAALRLGVKARDIVVQEGPRKARLHSLPTTTGRPAEEADVTGNREEAVCAPVRRSAP